MRLNASNLRETSAALDLACRLTHPADAVLREFFRARRELGSHDRAFIADTVFAVLRHKRLLEAIVPDPTPRRLAIASLVKLQGMSIGSLQPLLAAEDRDWLLQVRTADTESLPPAVRLSLPDWLWERLVTQYGEAEAVALGRALLQPAPLDLRVNTLIATRDEVLQALARDGIQARPTPYSPVGIRLAGKPAINRHPLFTRGAIEVQDEASQLLGFLLAPRRREMVVDFCAGAGGKTLLLGALMHNQGRVYAFDVSDKRLNSLKPRLKRSQLSNVHPQRLASENDTRVRRLAGKIDRILVDAPCSGLGTLRRNPDMKWRQSPQAVAELKAKQRLILWSAATLAKPGARLVYATCSLLREENEDIVEEFLATHPGFRSVDCQEVLDAQRIDLPTGPLFRTYPHRHGTDAFFAAVIERQA
ncbi:MAG TPA: RsmB/NOP family class I SAM-dependent RNA methyltransferase [Burkholderiales bacterium]|nr:RsmB/NOP family class I SAM-dependent RNA methyltransferase [Burkholderiales bacterium]